MALFFQVKFIIILAKPIDYTTALPSSPFLTEPWFLEQQYAQSLCSMLSPSQSCQSLVAGMPCRIWPIRYKEKSAGRLLLDSWFLKNGGIERKSYYALDAIMCKIRCLQRCQCLAKEVTTWGQKPDGWGWGNRRIRGTFDGIFESTSQCDNCVSLLFLIKENILSYKLLLSDYYHLQSDTIPAGQHSLGKSWNRIREQPVDFMRVSAPHMLVGKGSIMGCSGLGPKGLI